MRVLFKKKRKKNAVKCLRFTCVGDVISGLVPYGRQDLKFKFFLLAWTCVTSANDWTSQPVSDCSRTHEHRPHGSHHIATGFSVKRKRQEKTHKHKTE